MEKFQSTEVNLAVSGYLESLSSSVDFTQTGEILAFLISPKLTCTVRTQVSLAYPNWLRISFILQEYSPQHRERVEV